MGVFNDTLEQLVARATSQFGPRVRIQWQFDQAEPLDKRWHLRIESTNARTHLEWFGSTGIEAMQRAAEHLGVGG